MYKIAYITFAFISLLTIGVQAQTTLSGSVSDSNTGDPLIGAKVLVKGTTDGAVTDIDGSYTISSFKDYPLTVVISYIGFSEQ